MHSSYYITTYRTVLDNCELIPRATCMATDADYLGPILPETEVVVAVHATQQRLAWEQLPGVEPLPDALRGQKINDSHASKLAKHGIKKGHTTFDVIDNLTKRSKDMEFQIK